MNLYVPGSMLGYAPSDPRCVTCGHSLLWNLTWEHVTSCIDRAHEGPCEIVRLDLDHTPLPDSTPITCVTADVRALDKELASILKSDPVQLPA